MLNKLIVRELFNLQGEKKRIFCIPSYQRGYRWKKTQIELLLEDLVEFASSSEPYYCLQPLVLKKLGQPPPGWIENNPKLNLKDKEFYRVVDGQQRLTTLYLIANALNQKSKVSQNIWYEVEKIWISAESREKNDGENMDLNTRFRNAARETIGNWLDNHDYKKLISLFSPGKNQKDIFFVEYQIGDNEKEQDVFSRVNSKKIPLTSAELIRAVYMTSDLSENEKMEIAKEWDLMESSLRQIPIPSLFKVGNFFDAVRIDLLLSCILDVKIEDIQVNPLAVYLEFEKIIREKDVNKKNESLLEIWNDLLRCYWWIRSCAEDPELSNYLGWIVLFTDNQIQTLYNDKFKNGFEKFKKEVIEIIKKPFSDIEFESLDFYEDLNKKTWRGLFVLLNILYCNKRGEYFPFNLYKDQHWDIEHIHPQTPKEWDDFNENEKKPWLDFVGKLMKEKGRVVEEICKEIITKIRNNPDEPYKYKENADEPYKYKENADEPYKDKENVLWYPLKNENNIYNLALLDSKTNRGYKNATFPIKRQIIIEKVKEKTFIPPCTLNAFMKFYTENSSNMLEWNEEDAKAYCKAMKELFDEFMNK